MESTASYHQERLWFIDQFEAGNLYDAAPVYHNVPLILNIRGPLDISRLDWSIRQLIRRHEVLRTRLVGRNGRPVQKIEPDARFQLEYRDIAAQDGPPEWRQVMDLAIGESLRPFELDRDRLIRGTMFRRGERDFVLLLILHHGITDRLSLEIVTREICEFYRVQSKPKEAGLPRLSLHYKEFALWQRKIPPRLLKPALMYWKAQLRGPLQALELPTDRPRAPVHLFREGCLEMCLPPVLGTEAAACARRHDVEASSLLLSAFVLLLHRYCGQDEIVVGGSETNRTQPGTHRLVGPVANLVALRFRIRPEWRRHRFFSHVQQTAAEAHRYRVLPFDRLVEELNPEKDMSRTALFDVLFHYEEEPLERLEAAQLRVEVTETNRGWGKYDLNLLIQRRDGGLAGLLVYNAEYYDRWRMERLTAYYRRILEQLVQEDEGPLSRISLLDEAEERELLCRWSGEYRYAGYPRETTIAHLFNRQVTRQPGAVALTGPLPAEIGPEWGCQLSYGELERRSNCLAAGLQRHGVGPDRLVALLLERSVETVTAVLGVVKAGGGYLPLDPVYPEERLGFMLVDSRAAVVLTECRLRERAERFTPPGVNIRVPEEITDSSHPQLPPSSPAFTPDSLAYVIYTSGTTGRPKGAAVNHRQVVRLLVNDRFQFDFSPRDVWTLFHSYCFDFSVWEMYGALLHGGRLAVVPNPLARDTGEFILLLIREGVSVLNQTPSAFYRLIDEEAGRPLRELRLTYVIFGGEALNPVKLKEWRLRYPETRLINMFGITETTVHVTYKEIGDREIRDGISNIGRPIPTLSIFLLDRYRRLVPRGVAGELYVGGDGLSRGYVNRPELTAEKFVGRADISSFQHSLGSRSEPDPAPGLLYRSGDRVRLLAGGDLQYLGRIDHQVQIRGFRIELGEIESQMMRSGSLKEAVVQAREGKDRDLYLAAYIVPLPNSGTGIDTPARWRELLARSLPEYMIPAYFVRMDHIPLTANGKVDLTALPEPALHLIPARIPPRDEVEEKLAELWAEVLEIDKAVLGIDANFFELGGHSLKAAMLAARVHRELDVKIPLADIFGCPTIEGLAGFVRRAGEERFAAVAPAEKRDYYPLSSPQRRLYILQQMEPQLTTYNTFAVFDMDGAVDMGKIRGTFRNLIQRHESLRTIFRTIDGRPVQQILENREFDIQYDDLKGGKPGGPGFEFPDPDRLIRAFIRPFDLSRAPLLRVGMIMLREGKYILMVDMHHIVADGSSLDVLVADFLTLYRGDEPERLRLQYKDYSRWRQQESRSSYIRRQQAFWLDQLQGELPVLSLPYDYPRPPVQSFAGNRLTFEVDPAATAALKSLAARREATLFMLLLSVFSLLLSRLSGQEDIRVGVPVAARRHADLESIIGMFVNTLVMRNFPHWELPFGDFLREVRERTLQAFENQEYPFEDLVEDLSGSIGRDLGRNPLFDIMFVMQNIAIREIRIPGLILRHREVETRVSRFDLYLQGVPAADRLIFKLEYNTALFKRASVDRFFACFRNLLTAVSADPENRLGDIEIMTAAEKQRVAADFNRGAVLYPEGRWIHQLLTEQAVRCPHRIAVAAVCQLSYRELNDRVSRSARRLQAEGVRFDTIAGVMAERGPRMVIGVIGILKAGGAYLPIDPRLPPERIRYMLRESGADILLTTSAELKREVGTIENLTVLSLPLAECRCPPAISAAFPNPLAYCIYTSGSTGRPKGVLVRHRSLMNLLYTLSAAYPCGRADAYLLKTSFLFDVSVTELFGWIPGGGRLVILEPEGEKDPACILKSIERQRISHVNFVPAMFRSLLMMPVPGINARLSSLKYIFLAGETLPPELVTRFEEVRGSLDVRLENLYGPTEATVYASRYSAADWQGEGGIPIGRPLDNQQLYILDKHDRFQPVGVPGELCVGGCGVAAGYLNNPELTAEKFVMFRTPPGLCRLLYRTGDLARWRGDGAIEFLGRFDYQVKIRGFRIELGEIENRLRRHPEVTDAVVTAGKSETEADGDQYLCAYFLARQGLSGTIPGLREFMSRDLPAYMIPAYFMQLEQMPLTANGKIDRRLLPKPATGKVDDYTAPRDEIERRLAAIWSGVLNMEEDKIGIDADFFQLGGHSLKVNLLLLRIHKTFAVDLSFTTVFKNPRIRALAALIRAAAKNRYEPIEPEPPGESYTLSSAQRSLFVLHQWAEDDTAYNMPWAVLLEGDVNSHRLADIFRRLIRRHESLRTSFHIEDEGPVQRVWTQVAFHIEHRDLGAGEFEEARDGTPPPVVPAAPRWHKLARDFIRPFDLAQPPLCRVGLLRLEEKKYLLMVDLHHIISDALSQNILIRDFISLYRGKELPALRLQYKDYARWQKSPAYRRLIRQQEQFWLGEFQKEPPLLRLPLDYNRPEIPSFTGAVHEFSVGQARLAALKQIAAAERGSLNMVMLAVLYILLAGLSGQEDIVVGMPAAGRRHADVEDIIGVFINTLALRNYPADEKSFRQFQREVIHRCLLAYENQDYPFYTLVRKVWNHRDSARNPLFDVFFEVRSDDVHKNLDIEGRIPGLTISPCQLPFETAKLDMDWIGVYREDALKLRIIYCTALYGEGTIKKIARKYLTLIDRVIENPDLQIGDLKKCI